jgi:hypothetical protein
MELLKSEKVRCKNEGKEFKEQLSELREEIKVFNEKIAQ